MTSVTLVWIGDLDQDKRQVANYNSISNEKYRPKKIELKPSQKEIRIGRINSKNPPDYPIESCINSRMISRNHATIERLSKGGCMLYDHSMNGTYINYTRVTGGAILKHGDIICFGHLNGANLKPGETVSSFHSDLKYKVELSSPSPTKNSATAASATTGTKRKRRASGVSSNQRSDGEEDNDDDDVSRSEDDAVSDTSSTKHYHHHKQASAAKRPRKSTTEEVKKSISKPNGGPSSAPASGKKSAVVSGRKSSTGKSLNVPSSKRGGGAGRKSTGGSGQSGAANSELFHYDTEECSARPCRQPQDNAIDWIQCDKCTLWYHQICIGCKPSEADVETYYCPYCKGTA